MTRKRSRFLTQVYGGFWSVYGRFAWDDHGVLISEPPERIAGIVRGQRRDADEWVFDAGCGTGNYSLALAQAGFNVIGVDFADGMLRRAQEKTPDDLAAEIVFQQENLDKPLPFNDAQFDHVISLSVLQAVADYRFTLGELCRVLKPGGTMVLSLPRQDSTLFSQSIGSLIQERLRHLERRTPGSILLVILKTLGDRYHPTPRWTAKQAHELMTLSGLKPVLVEEGRQILVVAEKPEDSGLSRS